MPLSDYISAAWFGPRLASLFLGVLGVISMLLAGVGLYGVMAYSVSQRTREIGIRMALGAGPEGVLRMVMRQGLLLALLGIAAGLAISLASTPQLAPLLYRVSPTDPVSIAGAALFLIAVAVLASLIPALRATRVDPILALRRSDWPSGWASVRSGGVGGFGEIERVTPSFEWIVSHSYKEMSGWAGLLPTSRHRAGDQGGVRARTMSEVEAERVFRRAILPQNGMGCHEPSTTASTPKLTMPNGMLLL